MISPRCVLLLIAAVTLVIIPALGQPEAKMSFQQAGSPMMPFNVNQPVVYNIHLINPMPSFMRYHVVLEVGPDYNDYSISKKHSRYVDLDSGASQEIQFEVNYRSPELSRSEFGRWAQDNNDTSIWERSWYRATFTPKVGNPLRSLEGYDGQPSLIKMITVYRNADVSPKMGTDQTLYSYRVDLFSSAEDAVTLQVAPEAIGPWKDCGTYNYTNIGAWQTFRWENVSLDFDFIGAHYRFAGRKQTQVFEGPFWPVDYEYANESVYPPDGFSGTPFTYSLDFNGSKSLDVGLHVWDVDQNLFKLVEKKKYIDANSWQKMVWTGVTPSETIGSEGTSSYYFSIYYPGSENPLGTSREDEGKVYLGPDIVLIRYENPTVSPEKGSTVSRYTYSVEVETALPVCDIELQTSEPGSSIWRSQGIATYNGEPQISWKDVAFDGDVAGNVSFRFIRVASPPSIFQGPHLFRESIRGIVSPQNGSLGSWDASFHPPGERLARTPFVFTMEMDSVESNGPMMVDLEIYHPILDTWLPAGSPQNYNSSVGYLNFNVINLPQPFIENPFLGESRFRFRSGGRFLGGENGFPGPEIVANFKNITSSYDETRREFTYRTDIRSSQNNLSVALVYTMDDIVWNFETDLKAYTSDSAEWKRLEWRGYPYRMAINYVPIGS